MPTDKKTHEHSARITVPSNAKYSTYRTGEDKGGKGVNFVYGIRRKDGKSEVQSVRFDSNKWSVKDAKAWLDSNDFSYIKFTPATIKEDDAPAITTTSMGDASFAPKIGTIVSRYGDYKPTRKKKMKTESFMKKMKIALNEWSDEDEDESNEDALPTEPQPEDITISDSGPLGSLYSVGVVEGKFLGEVKTFEQALKLATDYMKKSNWYPNLWTISDHGNATLIDHKGNEVKSEAVVTEGKKRKLDTYFRTEYIASSMTDKTTKQVKEDWLDALKSGKFNEPTFAPAGLRERLSVMKDEILSNPNSLTVHVADKQN